MLKIFSIAVFATMSLTLAGCSSIEATPQGHAVTLVNEKSSIDSCRFLGEIIGSQGNWFTGDFTSNKALMIGARNDLRNQAAQLGGNTVHMQAMNNSRAWGSAGTSNTTLVGHVYRCRAS